ncbi:MAG: chromate resistance protein [Fibrobacteres bacterium]|nr:chromate resistance protein [Fibrobacterota bacterium]
MSAKPREWLLLMFEVSVSRSNLRVRVWRRLQALGAINLKGSVYALPKNRETEEDLEWIRQTIVDGGGKASLMTATHASAEDREFIRLFQAARDQEYLGFSKELAAFHRQLIQARKKGSAERIQAMRASLQDLIRSHGSIAKRDYFPSKAAAAIKGQLDALKKSLERKEGSALPAALAPSGLNARDYRGRKWVTRAGMHVDRLASAWLIRTFIDPKARFGFVGTKSARSVAPPALPFDMEGAVFGHHGENCTFESLLKTFALGKTPGLAALAEIIHDIDIKDERYGRPEAAGIDAFVRGLREETRNDAALLKSGLRFFNALHRALK